MNKKNTSYQYQKITTTSKTVKVPQQNRITTQSRTVTTKTTTNSRIRLKAEQSQRLILVSQK